MIRVETDKPMAISVDGEPFGFTPLECEVVPRALTVLIPQDVKPELFAPETSIDPQVLHEAK